MRSALQGQGVVSLLFNSKGLLKFKAKVLTGFNESKPSCFGIKTGSGKTGSGKI